MRVDGVGGGGGGKCGEERGKEKAAEFFYDVLVFWGFGGRFRGRFFHFFFHGLITIGMDTS